MGDFLTILAALAVLPFLAFCALGLGSWRASNFVRQPAKLDQRVVSGGLMNLCASGRLDPTPPRALPRPYPTLPRTLCHPEPYPNPNPTQPRTLPNPEPYPYPYP